MPILHRGETASMPAEVQRVRRLLHVALLVGSVLLAPFAGGGAPVSAYLPARAAAQPDGCRFVLGFAALHALIPAVVGTCLDDERHDPSSGDALQHTTGGVLVWRKADGLTAFTNGFESWVLGPFGLQQRRNDQRFWWEPNPDRLAITPPPAAGDRCHTAGLSLYLAGTDAGAGTVYATFRFVNETAVSCTLFGFVGAQLLDEHNDPLPTQVIRDPVLPPGTTGPQLVTVPAGGHATFVMHWGQVPVGDEAACPATSRLAVIPPDEFVPVVRTLSAVIRACGRGQLHVGPMIRG